MRSKLVVVITLVPLLSASLFGLLISFEAFSGHPPEWILDAYYSTFPESGAGGAVGLFLLVGLLSACLFAFSVARIFRRERVSRTDSDGEPA